MYILYMLLHSVDEAPSTSVQGLSDDHSMSAATTSKRTAKIRPDKLPKLTPQRSFEHGRFEEGKPKSQSFRAPAESPRPVTESMLYNLVAAAAFPAAPADKVLDVLANTPVADSRRHQVLGGENYMYVHTCMYIYNYKNLYIHVQ